MSDTANFATDAASAAKSVQSQAQNSDGAYNSLKQDIMNEEKKLGGPSSTAYKQYVADLSKDLSQAGVLPEMTLQWAKDSTNSTQLINASNDGGVIEQGIQNYLSSGNPSEFGYYRHGWTRPCQRPVWRLAN